MRWYDGMVKGEVFAYELCASLQIAGLLSTVLEELLHPAGDPFNASPLSRVEHLGGV